MDRRPEVSRTAPARIRLADYPPTPAQVDLRYRSRWHRFARVLVLASALPVAALVAFLIPPHGERFLLVVGGGLYLMYREATTSYVVRAFRGTCPRCARVLDLRPGSRLTRARSLTCYGCHFNPILELEPS